MIPTEKIAYLCWKSNGLYISLQQVLNEEVKERIGEDLIKYSSILSNKIMLVLVGIEKLSGEINENDVPHNVLGLACRALLMSLKAFMETNDGRRKEIIVSAIKRSLAIYLDVVRSIVGDSSIDINNVYNELNEVEEMVSAQEPPLS